ncbi:MAG TPA: hypothetical protein VFJ16_24220 [Longimicrobium sp.]|nr:hypothetical protein [Longimicrobium sp.]
MIAAMFGLCGVLLIVLMLLAICGHWFVELRLGRKLAVQCAWWLVTVPAMLCASAWWRENPHSSFRTLLAVASCIAMPGLGVGMAVRTVMPPKDAGSPPWYAITRKRASAGAGALRNARLRRD